VSRWTGVPVDKMLEGEREKSAHGGQTAERVVGQAEAVKAVVDRGAACACGLQDPHRPIGSFMFLGRRAWQTELTKTLAAYLFDDEQALIRIDMSESWRSTVARLIGAPPGYVATTKVAAHRSGAPASYQVVLFDEIEKAHPDVFNVLLQVLDDGRLTDGRAVRRFPHTVIAMTSNVGAEYLVSQPEGQDIEAVREPVMAELRARFRRNSSTASMRSSCSIRLKREHMGRSSTSR